MCWIKYAIDQKDVRWNTLIGPISRLLSTHIGFSPSIPISNCIKENISSKDILSHFIKYIFILVDEETKKLINEKLGFENEWDLLDRGYGSYFPGMDIACSIMDKYLMSIKKELDINTEQGLLYSQIPSVEDCISPYVLYMKYTQFPPDFIEKYRGISDEYDYIFFPHSFPYEKLKINWLIYYSNEHLATIKNCEFQRNIAISKLKEAIYNHDFIESNFQRLFSIYTFMLNQDQEWIY